MEVNLKLREQILDIIKNQLKSNNPPATKITYNRLISLGYSDFEVKQFIGQCIVVELFDILKHNKPFDEERYIKNLQQLPKKTFD
jgi:hypothetical protein